MQVLKCWDEERAQEEALSGRKVAYLLRGQDGRSRWVRGRVKGEDSRQRVEKELDFKIWSLSACWGYGKIDSHMYYWWDNQWLQSWRTLGNSRQDFSTYIHFARDWDFPLYICVQKDAGARMFFAALFLIANNWRQSKCFPIENWYNEVRHIEAIEYYRTAERMRSSSKCYDGKIHQTHC